MTDVTQQQVDAYLNGKAELHQILELAPGYVEQLKGRTQLFLDGGHTERALIMLDMLEELDRTDPTPSLVAAKLLLDDGRSDAAQEKIERVLKRDPKNPDGLVALAELEIATADLVGAAEILACVIDKDPDGKTDAGKRALAVAAEAHARYESA